MKDQAIWSVLAMVTIWLTIHTVKLNTIVPDYESMTNKINVLVHKLNELENAFDALNEVELTPFQEKFMDMRQQYGPGITFTWNGELYSTDYAEELTQNR